MKVKLTEEQIKLLIRLPEQGMGYHIVDIRLKNGRVLKEIVVVDSMYLQLSDDEKIDPIDIDMIQPHNPSRN